MSDHDPIDRQYAEAEALLDDEAARTARRAKVLAAVAAEPARPGAPARRILWGQGRWLAAAGVAGIGVLVGLRFYQPTSIEAPPPSPPAAVAPPVSGAPVPAAPSAAPAPDAVADAAAPAAPAPARPALPAPVVVAEARMATDLQTAVPAAPPPPPPAPPPSSARAVVASAPLAASSAQRARPAAAAPEEGTSVESVVVTGAFRRQPSEASKAADVAAVSPAKAASLRAAAASGSTAQLRALINEGIAVDTPDADGETALMKAVRARQAAAATLLRRQGADPDLKNKAGQSARDLAAALADPALDKALATPN